MAPPKSKAPVIIVGLLAFIALAGAGLWFLNQRDDEPVADAPVDAGVKVGFGTDSGGTPERVPGVAEHRELALMVEAGLTPLQALGIATREAAKVLQLNDRGTLEPGKRADFVVLGADPLVDIANTMNIVEVWARGRRGP